MKCTLRSIVRIALAIPTLGVLALASCSFFPMPEGWYAYQTQGAPTSFYDDCELDFQGYSGRYYYEPKAQLTTEWYNSFSRGIVVDAGTSVQTTVNALADTTFYFAYNLQGSANLEVLIDGNWTAWSSYSWPVYCVDFPAGIHTISFTCYGWEQWDKVFLDDLSLEFPPPEPVW